MDKLAPKLIRRAMKKDYVAIIIDPIYKVITGDENSADQMAAFCKQFDKVCTELGLGNLLPPPQQGQPGRQEINGQGIRLRRVRQGS